MPAFLDHVLEGAHFDLRVMRSNSPSCFPVVFASRSSFRLLLLVAALLAAGRAPAAVIDVWRADSLNLNDGDSVGTWASASNRVANAVVGQPTFRKNVTPAGGAAVRFNRNRLFAGNSPVGGRSAFSIACVFKATAVGANDAGANWYGKSGIVDAEQGGVVNDWGTVITETGNVGLGLGAGDTFKQFAVICAARGRNNVGL